MKNGQTNPIFLTFEISISNLKNKISYASFTHHPF
jgi:hypothetical protein